MVEYPHKISSHNSKYRAEQSVKRFKKFSQKAYLVRIKKVGKKWVVFVVGRRKF